ncbi:MAG: shufflon system plasmid conjugative transfer pilus tip adhesin PilV [Acetobacter sp.]|jgi:type II secretory pathway pseudopilin PulG|nr:shufflon system plasmid conjugative transfer pilus tip adhesin PilV [Acetobacter sp.]MCI1485832.1 shufflon system plasmid conjugative transfer pilus tip adhesin PilV [Acetobacter sp.]MCI1529786.1 shufflon system plasmid conjugative transfer pilus tip adhesin PilV [Acetobacter sp.]MCI1587545.1 shufflon system plasmid conjugative transfer pilus tip adhesin PilV [Acetobacter sp.]MCI1601762.1 shufflon system plasmid conjugative transfer pilus tip adhesin PilV [Acetobacter sp.]
MNTIVALMIASVIGIMILPRYYAMVENGTRQGSLAVTAGQFQDLIRAAGQYENAHASELTASVPIGGTTQIPLSTLINEHDLPPAFTPTNPDGQAWSVYIQQPTSGVLSAVIESSGGKSYIAKDEVSVAAMTGHQGGFVPYDGMLGGLTSNTAYGASGTWHFNMAGLPNPGPGHLVGLISGGTGASDAGVTTNDYLYRTAVAGHPELNTMRAPLDMGGNNINNANNVTATRGVFSGGNPNGGYGGVQVGSTYLYGDNTNAAIRTPGTVYLQHYNGSSANVVANAGYFNSNIGTYGHDPYTGLPSGWWGGVHSQDGYFEGVFGLGTYGNTNIYMDNAGYARIGDRLEVQHSVRVMQLGCVFTVGKACFYGDNDNVAIRAPGTAFVQHDDGSAADLNAGNVTATTVRLGTDNGNAWPGNGCGPNGALATKNDNSGLLLVCQSGVWHAPQAQISGYVPTTSNGFSGYNKTNSITGGYNCPAGTEDLGIETIWYGDYGYSALHLCSAQ